MGIDYDELMFTLSLACGRLARRCEQEKPDEQADADAMRSAAGSIRLAVVGAMCDIGHDPVEECASRLEEIASKRKITYAIPFGEALASGGPISWRQLQLADAAHDQACSPQLVRLAERGQLCRHVVRLAAAMGTILSPANDGEDGSPVVRGLADLLLLAVRLPTTVGEELSDNPVPRSSEDLQAALYDETFEF